MYLRRILLISISLSMTYSHVNGVPCDTLTDNVFTSENCPSQCRTNPCVLYSPKLEQTAPCLESQGSGLCLNETDYKLSDGSICDLTFQCMDNLVIVDKGVENWIITLVPSQTLTTTAYAPVTSFKNVKYPPNVPKVQILGGFDSATDSQVKSVSFDDSVFKTPATVVNFIMTNIDLSEKINDVKFSTQLQGLYLVNTRLKQVPSQLTQFTSLISLGLSKNRIKEFPGTESPMYEALQNLQALEIEMNQLEEFTTNLPNLQILKLNGNPLKSVPEVVYNMTNLNQLELTDCDINDLELSSTQFDTLNGINNFELPTSVSECNDGYVSKTSATGDWAACVKSSNSTNSNGTLYLAIGIGIAVVCIIIVGFIVKRKCEKKTHLPRSSNDYYPHSGKPYDKTMYPEYASDFGTGNSSSIWNDPDLLAVRIDYREVECVKLLSRGGFGEVWLGVYLNQNVAVKKLLEDKRSMTEALAFAVEIKIMARLSHPKIVHFIGVAWTTIITIQAITEFMDCGDLKSLLESQASSSITWANLKCQIATDIADALVYLHTLSPKLIHRDLKSRNVLIDAHNGAKLSDFGISRNRSVEETMTAGVGTARWIAPEVILGGHYTESADIYSFGVVLSELDTCQTPYFDAENTNGAKMQDVTILQQVSSGKLKPSFTGSCPKSIYNLAMSCLEFDPAQRPSAIHVSFELRQIMKDEL